MNPQKEYHDRQSSDSTMEANINTRITLRLSARELQSNHGSRIHMELKICTVDLILIRLYL